MKSISNPQFYHLQRRTSDVKFKPSKFCFYKKKIFNCKKKFQKSLFGKKKTFYWTWIWKMLWSNWAQKKFQQEKIQNWRCGIHLKKNTLNHTSGTQKNVFFNFVFWEVFLYAVSTYCKLYCSLTKFLYTLLYSSYNMVFLVDLCIIYHSFNFFKLRKHGNSEDKSEQYSPMILNPKIVSIQYFKSSSAVLANSFWGDVVLKIYLGMKTTF